MLPEKPSLQYLNGHGTLGFSLLETLIDAALT